jgi:hypothetical protein
MIQVVRYQCDVFVKVGLGSSRWRRGWVFAFLGFVAGASHAERVGWESQAGAFNLSSSGGPMDAGFVFQLGVFSNGFVPTVGNLAKWDLFWNVVDEASYNESQNRFAGLFEVRANDPLISAGTAAWIMGTKVTPTGTEKILVRRPSWTWPSPNPFNPTGPIWEVQGDENIQVVIGSVNPGGSPILMQSEVVRNYEQWRQLRLAGEPIDGAGDDPDGDGVPNMLEFVFDTDPKDPASHASIIGELVDVDGEQYLQLFIPRKRTHLVRLEVQVSSDLMIWSEGPEFTKVVEEAPLQWIVRDKTAVSSAPNGRRFIRLKAEFSAE